MQAISVKGSHHLDLACEGLSQWGYPVNYVGTIGLLLALNAPACHPLL